MAGAQVEGPREEPEEVTVQWAITGSGEKEVTHGQGEDQGNYG